MSTEKQLDAFERKLTCEKCLFLGELDAFDCVGADAGNVFCPNCNAQIDSDTGQLPRMPKHTKCLACDATFPMRTLRALEIELTDEAPLLDSQEITRLWQCPNCQAAFPPAEWQAFALPETTTFIPTDDKDMNDRH